jgi:hypothetical protein
LRDLDALFAMGGSGNGGGKLFVKAASSEGLVRRSHQSKMQSMDLVALPSRSEGKTLEFKRDLSSPEGALKTIVAFANTSGGALLIGIEDGAKGVKGVPDILKEEERLANLIADNISPKVVPSIEVIAWRKSRLQSLGETLLPAQVELPLSRDHSLDCLAQDVLLQHWRWPARVCAFHAVGASLVELVQ